MRRHERVNPQFYFERETEKKCYERFYQPLSRRSATARIKNKIMKNTNKNLLSISGLCLILLTVLFAFSQAHAQGSNLIVNTLADGDDTACNEANCTLREAVKYAPPGATISFSVTGIIQLVGAGITRDLVINKNLTIAGPGADSLTVKAANGYTVGVFEINGGIVSISGLKLSDGNGNAITTRDPDTGVVTGTQYYGGAIYIAGGTVTLTNCTLSNNTAQYGGAIYLGGGSLAVTGSTISGNNSGSGAYGGGIYVGNGSLAVASSTISGNIAGFGGGLDISGGTATIENSTISGNTAREYTTQDSMFPTVFYSHNGNGGGIFINFTATVTVTNSTISGNRAEGTTVISGSTQTQPGAEGGGGILNHGVLTVVNSTVTANHARRDAGGGINTSLGTLQLSNSILANSFLINSFNNTPNSDLIGNRVYGVSGNYNLVQNGATITGTNNITGQPALLGPLANNGGPTQTHALLFGSPAIDKGSAAGADQRGLTRPSDDPSIPNAADGNGADIGALEVQIAPPASAADLTVVKSHTGNFTQGDTGKTYSITVTNSGGTATSGNVSAVDTLPTGLTATAITGIGWTCTLGTLTCTRSDALAATNSYPAITLTVNVADNASSSVTNLATASGGGETNTANNTANDLTTINAAAATYSLSGQITNGGEALSGVTVSLSGSATASTTTSAAGSYSFANVPGGGNFTLTPSLNGYAFVQPAVTLNNLAGNQSNLNFSTSVITFEGDVATRPTGDGAVDILDIITVGNIIAKLPGVAAPAAGGEFQRADAAPRLTKGDGSVDVQDLIQLQLYAAVLNPLTPASGAVTTVAPPASPLLENFDGDKSGVDKFGYDGFTEQSGVSSDQLNAPAAGSATVSAGTTTASGGTAVIPIQLNSSNVGGVQFTVTYDAAKLSIPSLAAITNRAANVSFTFNNSTPGQLGVVAFQSTAGDVFPASALLFNINFTVAGGAAAGTTPISFGNTPVPIKASDPAANAATITTTPGAVTILGPTAANVSISGRATTATGRGIRNVLIRLTDAQGNVKIAYTTTFGYYRFAEVAAGETYVITAKGKRYEFSQSTQVINVNEDTVDINFTANF